MTLAQLNAMTLWELKRITELRQAELSGLLARSWDTLPGALISFVIAIAVAAVAPIAVSIDDLSLRLPFALAAGAAWGGLCVGLWPWLRATHELDVFTRDMKALAKAIKAAPL